MKVYFRLDSSFQMGGGHLMRCLTLAVALREQGAQVRFFCRHAVGHLMEALREQHFPVTVLSVLIQTDQDDRGYPWCEGVQREDAAQTIQAFAEERPDWLVVDHYGLDIEWERRLKPHTGRLMVVDDFTGRHHDCELLIDQNYSAGGELRYNSLVPASCKVLLGPGYALLRKEFKSLRDMLGVRQNGLNNILVFFTAGDDQGATLRAMRGIELFGHVVRVEVVVGRENPDLEEIKAHCERQGWGYHCEINYMPKLIAQANLVIGAGGSSNWERCALGVPALVVILAENQALIARELDCAGVVCNLGWSSQVMAEDYAAALKMMDSQRLAEMSARALQLVDAVGAHRVAEVMI